MLNEFSCNLTFDKFIPTRFQEDPMNFLERVWEIIRNMWKMHKFQTDLLPVGWMWHVYTESAIISILTYRWQYNYEPDVIRTGPLVTMHNLRHQTKHHQVMSTSYFGLVYQANKFSTILSFFEVSTVPLQFIITCLKFIPTKFMENHELSRRSLKDFESKNFKMPDFLLGRANISQ